MNTLQRRIFCTALFLVLTFALTTIVQAQSYKEATNLGTPAVYPASPFTADAAGNLYTPLGNGGTTVCIFYGCGAIYQWKPNAHKLPVMLYSFTGNADGYGPGGRVVLDAQGNIYGTAGSGGDYSACFGQGCGIVYKLTPATSVPWNLTVLYSFQGDSDGQTPNSVILDAHGNLFGSTRSGGGSSCTGGGQCGTVFELSPNSTGGWTETVLHTFTGGADGGVPLGSLALDAQGNLYGTADLGGVTSTSCPSGCGTVFELSPASSGWTFTTLYSFDYTHGANPVGSPVLDAAGNVYGATYAGGRQFSFCPGGCGVIYQLSPTASGWKQSLLHTFSGPDGGNPQAGLTLDTSGNIYGTTTIGGNSPCTSGYQTGCGVVFELSPISGGHWLYNHLYRFQGFDGFYPNGQPLVDSSGNIFGTTVEGLIGVGNFYKLSPTH